MHASGVDRGARACFATASVSDSVDASRLDAGVDEKGRDRGVGVGVGVGVDLASSSS